MTTLKNASLSYKKPTKKAPPAADKEIIEEKPEAPAAPVDDPELTAEDYLKNLLSDHIGEGDPTASVHIYRYVDPEKSSKKEYVFETTPQEYLAPGGGPAMIRKLAGPGSYEVRAYRVQGGGLYGCKRIDIAKLLSNETTPAAPQSADSALVAEIRALRESVAAMRATPAAAPASLTELTTALKQLDDMRGGAPKTAAEAMSLKEVIELAGSLNRMANRGGDSAAQSNFYSLMERLLPALAPALAPLLGKALANGAPGATPAALPAPDQSAAITEGSDMGVILDAMIKHKINDVIAAIGAGVTPAQAAPEIINALPADWLDQFMLKPMTERIAYLNKLEPKTASYGAWFAELFDVIDKAIYQQNTGPADTSKTG